MPEQAGVLLQLVRQVLVGEQGPLSDSRSPRPQTGGAPSGATCVNGVATGGNQATGTITLPLDSCRSYAANGKDRLQRRKSGLKKVMADFGEEAANAYKKYLSMGRRYGRFFWDQALDFGQYEVGDCTFHSGWTTHAAPPAVTNKGERHKKIPREAVTVSFIDGAARKVPKSVWYRGYANVAEEDYISYGRWYDKVPDGEFLESDILPVMWPREGNQSGEPRGDAEL